MSFDEQDLFKVENTKILEKKTEKIKDLGSQATKFFIDFPIPEQSSRVGHSHTYFMTRVDTSPRISAIFFMFLFVIASHTRSGY